MAKFVLFVLALPVITLLQQCQETQGGIFAAALTGIMNLIGILSGLMGIYSFLDVYLAMPEQTQKLSNYGLQQISATNQLKELKNGLSNLREEIRFDVKIDELIKLIDNVEYVFRDFVIYSNKFNKSSSQNKFQNVTYRLYTDYVFNAASMGIERTLDQIKNLVAPNSNVIPGLAFLQLRVLNSKELDYMCKFKLSQMQVIGQLLGKIALVEAKGILSILFAYDLFEWLGNATQPLSEERNKVKVRSLERYNTFVAQFQQVLQSKSNQLYVCDPKEHVKFKTYTMLESVLDKKQGNNVCREDFCSARYYELLEVCSDEILSTAKRYTPIYRTFALGDIQFLLKHSGSVRVCFDYQEKRYIFSIIFVTAPQLFFCTCSFKYKYFVNLEYTTANVDQNFVVTGTRLVVQDNIIHLQLQEGQLGPYGNINGSTLHWIPLQRPTIMRAITMYHHHVLLTHVTVPPQNVVTGASIHFLMFDALTGVFGLNLGYMPINFTMGTLGHTLDYVNVKMPSNLHSLTVSHLDDPTTINNNILDSTDNDYLTIYSDSGTNMTTPYLDLQDVVSKQPTPLSGLSFIHKGTNKSSGFLGLSIFTYDIKSHVQLEYTNNTQIFNAIQYLN